MPENKIIIHTHEVPDCKSTPSMTKKSRFPRLQKFSFHTSAKTPAHAGMTQRLMRNTTIACALILGILVLGDVDSPWAQRASNSVRQALTMQIDLDDSLGSMQFVQAILPEEAYAFWNFSSAQQNLPSDGEITHSWSAQQPWILYSLDLSQNIYAAGEGIIAAVTPLSGGDYGVLIDHGEGVESVYAYLGEVCVSAGESVAKGQMIGRPSQTDPKLYFELRKNGESIDPQEMIRS